MIKSNSPNFIKCNSIANELLVKSNVIKSFPFDIMKVVTEYNPNIVCRSFSTAQKYGLAAQDLGSNSATIQKIDDKYIIFYNQNENKPRVDFDIGHEFNHVNCGHKLYSNQKFLKLTDIEQQEYDMQEIETNFTTAMMFMPDIIIKEFQKRGKRIDNSFLQTVFGVSRTAAEKKVKYLSTSFYTNCRFNSIDIYEDILLKKYYEWINSKVPQNKFFMYDDEIEKESERDRWY